MLKKRFGFSMIELVFVIVVLGILAAVAVPKLAATRTDAAQTAAFASFQKAVDQIQSLSAATGAIPADFRSVLDGSTQFVVGRQGFVAAPKGLDIPQNNVCAFAEVAGDTLELRAGMGINNPECVLFTRLALAGSVVVIPLVGPNLF